MFWKRIFPPSLDFLDAREYFIPVDYHVILETLLRDDRLSDAERADLELVGVMLREHYHHDYHNELLELKRKFAPFNPDGETVWEPEYSEAEKEAFRDGLMRGVTRLLEVGNYRILSEAEFNECLKLQPFSGLSVSVDTTAFETFHVYYRGVRTVPETSRFYYFWKKTREVRQLKRVFVLARYKKEYGHKILVKLFRDVAVENLKIIAPEVRLALPIFDRFKIGGTVFGSIFMPLYKLLVAVTLSWVLFFTFLAFFVVAMIKGVLGFFNSRIRCMQVYSSSLYHQILSNNLGAMNSLVDQAEDQEVKEAFLAYAFLYLYREKPLTEKELDGVIETWLEEAFHFAVDFEVDDALRKLREKNLMEAFPDGNGETVYRVYDIPSALRRLDEHWDTIHMHNNKGTAEADALA